MHAHGHKDVTTHKHSEQDQKQWVVSALEAHTTHDTVGVHQISPIDQLRDCTGYRKVRSCDTLP